LAQTLIRDRLIDHPMRIQHYEPAVVEWADMPEPYEMVACLDVLEHIEPALLDNVLDDLQRVTKSIGLFTVSTVEAMKVLPDGRNAHLIVELSADDRRTWCMFMPTGYYSDSRMAPAEEWLRSHNLANYQYADGVPMHVRALMKTLQPIMSTLEIRTVETTPVISDPALFGHIVLPNGERKIYLLARWGESDQNFVRDIEDVKKVLKARMGISYYVERRYPQQLSSEGGLIGSTIALLALGMLFSFLTLGISSALGYRLESPALPVTMLLLPIATTMLAIGTNRALRGVRRANLAKCEPRLAKLV
jgi:hypothetical protein